MNTNPHSSLPSSQATDTAGGVRAIASPAPIQLSDQHHTGESDAKSADQSAVYKNLIDRRRHPAKGVEHQPSRNMNDAAPNESAADEISSPIQEVLQ